MRLGLFLSRGCPVFRFRLSAMMLAATCLCSPATLWAADPAPAPSTWPRELGKPQDDLTLDIRAFQVDGLPEGNAQALAAVTAPYVGKGKGYEDLVNAAAAVTRYIQRDLGYYVGFAYVPEQSPKDGVVRLQALEGRLDQVIINAPEGDTRQRDLVAAQLASLKPGEVLRTSEVERAVLLLNDLRGMSAKVELEEGRQLGTASLRVTPKAESAVAWRLDVDTLGNRYTGLGRVSGAVTVANPLQRGDALSAQLLSSHTGGLRQGSLSYVLPVGEQGLKVGGALARVEYGLDKSDFPAVYEGSVVAAGAYALYPMVRSRNFNLFGLLSYEHKDFDDHQAGTTFTKLSNDWALGLIGDSRDSWLGGGINTYELQLLQGRMGFGAGANPLGLDRNFNKATLGYSRLQAVLPGRLQLYGRYKAQLSGTSLDASERYAAGGPLGVRAFGPGEAAADNAHVVNAELRWLPPEDWFGAIARELVFTAFYDWAHVKFFHDPALQSTGVANTGTLSGAGLGMIWDRPGNMSLRLDLAWRGAGDALADPKDHEPRANAVFTKRF